MKLEEISRIALSAAARRLQHHDAEDVAQTVTMKILKLGIASTVSHAYVFVLATWRAFDRIKANHRLIRGKSLSNHWTMEAALLIKAPGQDPRHDAIATLKEALSSLSPQEMDAIAWKSSTANEIGQRVGLSPVAVRSRESRAVKKLREKVKQAEMLLN